MEKVLSDKVKNILFISNIPRNTQREELARLFSPCGSLICVNVIYKPNYAFAFAEFDDMRDAAFAIRELHNFPFKGLNMNVKYKSAKGK